MNLYGKNFTFNGINSSKYDFVVCEFDTPDLITDTAISSVINKSELTPFRNVVNTYTRTYEDVLKFTISICKPNGEAFQEMERREIVGWITSPKYPVLLTVEDDDSDYNDNIEYFCQCTAYSEFRPNGDICGLIFKMECNAPYGFSPEEVTPFDIIDTDIIQINNTSDEWNDDYYPIIEITGKSSGIQSVLLFNDRYPDNILKLNIKNGQHLVIDNFQGDISDNTNTFNYSEDTNLKWIKLKHGINNITINGNVSGCFRCRYIRKVGI